MRQVNYLLVGGGVASLRAAEQIRKIDNQASILLVSDEPAPPYERPPLSKEYLAGEKPREALLLQGPDKLSELGVECLVDQRVASLDVTLRAATLGNGKLIGFEKALIATGGRPVHLDVPGSELVGIHYLRTLQDADDLRTEARPGRRAVVIGGGFIGLETAATLCRKGVEVTVVEAMPTVWARFSSPELSGFVSDYCRDKGVTIRTSALVSEFRGEHRVEAVVLGTGEELACDFVCVGVGIRPNVELAERAGLLVDNGVVVDEGMRTSDPCIYAAGDLINYPDPYSDGRRRRVEHWGHAESSGQVAGVNMAGGHQTYDLVSYVWSDVFDAHFEFAGDEHDHDTRICRGDPASGAFMIVYLREGRVRAFCAVNTAAREYSIVRRMIQTRKSVAGLEARLSDPATGLRELLSA